MRLTTRRARASAVASAAPGGVTDHIAHSAKRVLETVVDASDLFDVLVAAFPPSLQRLSKPEQALALTNPALWPFFDKEAFVQGFLTWLAQEQFHGRIVGSIETRFGQQIGASNYYGTGATSRTWSGDPVTAFTNWLFSS